MNYSYIHPHCLVQACRAVTISSPSICWLATQELLPCALVLVSVYKVIADIVSGLADLPCFLFPNNMFDFHISERVKHSFLNKFLSIQIQFTQLRFETKCQFIDWVFRICSNLFMSSLSF